MPRDVVIPDTLGGNPVTVIGGSGLASKNLTSVVIPNTVTTINNSAFGYNHLTSITIPDSVTTIDISAFDQDPITSLTIPSSVTTLGDTAFRGNQLISVTIEGDITNVGSNIFQSNPITSFTYNGTTYTSSDPITDDCYQFDAGTNTITSFNLANINTIKAHDNACLNKNISIPSTISGVSVTAIGGYAFDGDGLTSVTIPDSVTAIGENAFQLNQLTSVTIPDSVISISSGAFLRNNLETVVIKNPNATVGDGTTFMLQLKSGGASIADFVSDPSYAAGQAILDSVIYTQIYTTNPNPSSIGLANFAMTEADLFGGDINGNGNTDDIISAQIINPAYISIVYQDQDGNPITPPSSAPTMITGNVSGTNLTSYLVKDNPDPTNFSNFYKAGDSFNQTITPPAISGYTTPPAKNLNLTLQTGPNEVTLTYTAKPSNGNGGNNGTSPTTTINTGNTQLGSSNHTSTTKSDSIPIIPAKPTFSGTTYPNAKVTVTVHSDPISCTTTASSTGKWSCTLPKSLAPGLHTVYVTIQHGSQTDHLGPYKVRVVAGTQATLNSDDLADTGMNSSLVATLASAMVVIGGAALALLWKKRRA